MSRQAETPTATRRQLDVDVVLEIVVRDHAGDPRAPKRSAVS